MFVDYRTEGASPELLPFHAHNDHQIAALPRP